MTDRHTSRGGAPRHLRAVVRWQLEHGHEVHVAAGETDDEPGDATVHVVSGLAARGAQAADVERVWRGLQPDVVHLHTVVNPTVLEWGAAHRAVVTVQDHRYFCPGRGKWTRSGAVCRDALSPSVCAACFEDEAYFTEILGLTERRLAALGALRAIVLSDYMKRELVAAGVAAAGVTVIPPFVDALDPAVKADGPACVLFVGRLTEHKGAREAVQAWTLSRLDLPLVMAGTGPLREELVRAGAVVLGWLDPLSLSRVYRRAHALLFPSRWQEPFGIAGLEALSMGVPVAAWDSGGVGEWHGSGGLVPWGDVAGLAAALRHAVAGPRATPPRGFDREEQMARLEAVYAETAV